MKINKLLIGAVLAIAIVSPIAAFVRRQEVPQPMPIADVRVPFLHGFVSSTESGHGDSPRSSARMIGSTRRR